MSRHLNRPEAPARQGPSVGPDWRELEQRIGQGLRKHQFRLKRELERLRAEQRGGKDIGARLERLRLQLQESLALRQARTASVPELNYPEELPVSGKRDEILAALKAHQVLIVCGETGSGKTTQLPKICLEAGRGASGYIGHTQPRRIAARTVAARIAEELKQPLGKAVGYKVRFQDQTSPESLVKLMTDGILLAETQQDRFLDAYDTLIVDEAHERSLNIDFLLGYLKWLLPRRPDFKLIVTSATIDPERFSSHFGGAPIIEVSGRTYPVELRYRPVHTEGEDETESEGQRAIVDAVAELHRESPGDILVFLSGEREIRETAESLRKHHPVDCEILPLFSRLSNSEQERVFKPHGKRRIVLATNVAETSLTVPGIRAVIDTGHARISRYSHRSKLQRLPIERISQASANQRAGRCGRTGPGVCIRLYSEEDYLARSEFTDPEILRTNLAAVILQMKALGLGDLADFPFLQPPDERMVRDGLRTLQELNALDEKRQLTDIGRKLAKLPVDPRLGRILVAASDENSLSEVAIIVAALSLQDPRERPADRQQAADQKHARFKDENSDFLGLLKLWRDFEEQKKHLSNSKLRRYCQENFISYLRMREWEDIHQQILQVAKGELALRFNQAPSEYGEIHRPLLTGFLSNIGFRQEQSEYLGARGLKFQIFPGSFLFKSRPKWIMAAEQVETSKVYARCVAKIEPEWVERCGAHLVKRQYYDPHWEKKAARAAVYEKLSLFGLVVLTGRRVPYENVDPVAAREIFIRSALVELSYDSRARFFQQNRQLLEAADYLQQKGRRVDLVADEEAIYRFYDERIPAEVVNGVSFEVWRKQAEKENPDVLCMTRQDITRRQDESVNPGNFPDHWTLGDLHLTLEYRFEPGHEDDGVTLLVPLHLLNQFDGAPFVWLVPGLFREKLVALIKNLPKAYRRNFVPAPDYADRVLELLEPGLGDLFKALSAALKRLTGISVPLDAWTEEGLAEHLRMGFALLDESQVVVAKSRDLGALKRQFGGEAVRNFKVLAAESLSRTGCTDWAFGDLPEQFHSGQIQGYTGLVDEGATVGLRIFDTAPAAQASHRQGLIRLFRLALAKELKYLRRNLALKPTAELAYRQLPPHPFLAVPDGAGRELRDDLLDCIMGTLFVEGLEPIRGRAQFEARLEAQRRSLVEVANRSADRVAAALEGYAALSGRLKGSGSATAADLREQLGLMVYAGFLVTIPHDALAELPRYLKAMLYRLDKAMQDPARDLRLMAEVTPMWQAYWQRVRKGQEDQGPERDPFRWSLEEFRVSQFAQVLKTAYPISAKRLAEAWSKKLGKTA